ncbi:hypothetical protein PybrP1_002703 [[Pythium] brassicae (nom. inval.)]|nr:hypothetical protein PybrP1_002703 [[Pythium] brassicae (nom. inval.)]
MNVLATTSALLLASLSSVAAHGNIVEPPAVWQQGYPTNGYVAEISNTIWGEMDGSKYGYGPEGALKYWTINFPKSGVSTLRDFIMKNQKMYSADKSPTCGDTTKDDAKRQAMPSTIKFTGFTHPGPCELWCDDKKLVFDNDCQTKYPTGMVPVDASKCAGADKFALYWIGVQGTPWQVYTNCVYLSGSKGGSGAAAKPAIPANPAAMKKPATTARPAVTKKPAAAKKPAATKKRTTSEVGADADEEYPTTEAPAAATPAATKKCLRKLRE